MVSEVLDPIDKSGRCRDGSFLFLTRILSSQDVFLRNNMFYFVFYQPYAITISVLCILRRYTGST